MTKHEPTNLRVAIPLQGKMGTRTFHTTHVKEVFLKESLQPCYFISPNHYELLEENLKSSYGVLRSDLIDRYLAQHPGIARSILLRYFCTLTESADLRFREYLENDIYQYGPILRYGVNALLIEMLRRVPGIGRIALRYENAHIRTSFHKQSLLEADIDVVITPGVGNWAFTDELFLAREAINMGLPVFAVITNYDNLVNKGYRGFMPVCLAVWSKQMAEDAIRLHNIPASRIEIVGPVQYDLFIKHPEESREQFLSARGLDPGKKTIFYAASANTLRMFEFYELIVQNKARQLIDQCNIIIRAYPFPRVLTSPEWLFMRKILNDTPDIYMSNPLPFEVEDVVVKSDKLDLWGDQDLEELHGLLSYSDVMVNHYSTISLEAAICNLPTIHIDYDSHTYGRQFKQRSEFLRRMTHNKRPARLAAAKIVKSQKELLDAIEDYLSDRSIHDAERREYATFELGDLDGQACERLAQMIKSRIP